MADTSVGQFAKMINIDPELLLSKLKQAGIEKSHIDDAISDVEKEQLLAFIQKSGAKKSGVTLKRRQTQQVKAGDRKVNVQVKKKRTVKKPAEASVSHQQTEQSKTDQSAPVEDHPTESVSNQSLQAASEPLDTSVDSHIDQTVETPTEPATKTDNADIAMTTPADDPVQPAQSSKPQKDHGFQITSRPTPTAQTEPDEPSEKTEKSESTTNKKKPNFRKPAAEPESAKSKKSTGNKTHKQKNAKFDDERGNARKADKRGKRKGRGDRQGDQQTSQQSAQPIKREVALYDGITVGELAQRMAVKSGEVIKQLMKLGVMATINQSLDRDTAVLIVEEFGHTYTQQKDKEEQLEQSLAEDQEKQPAGEGQLRAPVVTIMGHVDHGKTSLLDYIRKARIAASEAGGITQHIGAYSVATETGRVTFLDTPGHEAFTAMRARGASSTDIVILVVAADDGVKPQTIEAVQHAQAAGVPIVVAINKMDKEGANPDQVKTELSNYEIIPEDWGGDTIFIELSAHTGQGVNDLLESLALQAEVMELKAIPAGPAKGVVAESRLEKGRGPVATILVKEGCLQKGDVILCGTEYGRVRAMYNDLGQDVKQAGPSTPVEILGLSGVPNAGDEVLTVKDEKKAREVAEFRMQKEKEMRLKQQQAAKLSNLFDRMQDSNEDKKVLNVILKADMQGSVEAIKEALLKLSTDEVRVDVIASGIGAITASDVNLAVASNAIIFGFNVRADAAAKRQIEQDEAELRYYSVIYDLIDDVKQAMSGMLSPELREQIVGVAQVRDVFRSSKLGAIAGCMVTEGVIKRNNPIRVLRDQVVVYEGSLESLKRYKEDANEIKKGLECGIGVKNYNDVKVGDQIEVYETIEVKKEI